MARSARLASAIARWGGALAAIPVALLAVSGAPGLAGQADTAGSRPFVPDPLAAAQHADVRLEAFAAPYLGPDRRATVLLGIEATAAGPAAADTPVAVQYRVIPRAGATVEGLASLHPGRTDAEARPAPYLVELSLAPGRYDIAVTSRVGGHAGPSVEIPLDVPAPAAPGTTGFAISPLVLASSRSPADTPGPASEERARLPILLRPPTPSRTFTPDEQVELFAEIYDWESEPGQELQFAVATAIRTRAGTTVFSIEELGLSEPLISRRYGFAHSTLVPVHRLPPGEYVLEVQVRSLVDPATSEARTTRFTVAPPAIPHP